MPEENQGLDDGAIERETAIALPERDALSIIGPGGKFVPLPEAVIPEITPTEPKTDPVWTNDPVSRE